MKSITRREFLAGGVALAALSAGGSLAGRAAAARARVRYPDSLPFPGLPAGTDTMPQIEHILVLMMENHSYDNYLGMLGRGPGQTPRGDGFRLGPNGLPTATNTYANGWIQHAFEMPTTCQLPKKPSQEWQQSHIQYANGTNAGFVVSDSGPVAMGYWSENDLPWSYSLANTFPLADRWFCSVLGQTYPNRRYLLAATSVGMTDNVFAQLLTPAPNGTIFDRLNAHDIGWRNYYSTLPSADLFLEDGQDNQSHLVLIPQFFTDAKSGRLPAFAIIDPNFTTQSEENPQDIVVGEVFASQVVDAVFNSPAWDRTLLIWTFDEHGGYYDHVPPPVAIAPDNIAPLVAPGESTFDGFHRYGFRVPAVVVSPWARPNHVTSVIHDHTSILAMLERKWNLPALTHRDANAADLTDFLDLNHPAFAHPPTLAAPAAGPAQLACQTGGPGTIPPPGSVTIRNTRN